MEEPGRPPDGTTLTPDRLDLPADDPLLVELFPPLASGVEWSLDRVEALLESTGSPHHSYPSIHIAGTNGKGSVASTASSVLGASGKDVGLYTSPHLCSFRERFRVGGETISGDELRCLADELRDPIVRHGLTFFEAATVLAFHLFRRREVDIAVLEVGLGGRLDATNVVRPLVSAITNVAMDHADYLGDSVERIAREKAGIIKSGIPVLTAEEDPAVRSILSEVALRRGAPLRQVGLRGDGAELEIEEDHTSFTVHTERWGTIRLTTPLVGRHQAMNAALAVGIVEALPVELLPDRDEVVAGVESVRWPGRSQVEHLDDTTWLFDVAHNPAGVGSLVEVIDRIALPRPRVLLLGVLGDKDWGAMLPALFERADVAVLTQPPSAPVDRRWDPALAAESGGERCADLRIEPVFDLALASVASAGSGGTVVVTGSNHTVGDALCRLGLDPV